MNAPLDLQTILFGEVDEGQVALQPSTGAIPPELAGTYYLNGPGKLRRGDFRYKHWLDGDGLVRALRFNNGEAEHLTRFVRTTKFTQEEDAGRPLFRAFGTSFAGDKLRRRMTLESPANVSIWPFAGRLLAFGEQALPWELSPLTLETLGGCNFKRKLLEISPFSAHPKLDRRNRRLCNFGLKYLMTGTKLCYWEFDSGFDCCCAFEVDLDASYSVHDYALSEHHAVFYLSPYLLDIGAFVRGGKSVHDALEWHPQQENILLLAPRDDGGKPVRISLGCRGYCLHMIQAFEQATTLTIDLLETVEPLYPQYRPLPSLFESVKPCALVRITIDLATGAVLNADKTQQDVHLDFPALHRTGPGSCRDLVWVLGMPVEPIGQSKYYDRILCFNWEQGRVIDTYHAPENSFLSGEPSIAPCPSDSRGAAALYLICPLWHAGRNESAYIILDAFDLAAGPISVLPLPAPSPLGFHSCYEPVITH